jgi:predicted  nucleic acid-binding Zn-ribbon protein
MIAGIALAVSIAFSLHSFRSFSRSNALPSMSHLLWLLTLQSLGYGIAFAVLAVAAQLCVTSAGNLPRPGRGSEYFSSECAQLPGVPNSGPGLPSPRAIIHAFSTSPGGTARREQGGQLPAGSCEPHSPTRELLLEPLTLLRNIAWRHSGALERRDANSQTSLTWSRLEALERENKHLHGLYARLRRERDELDKQLLVINARMAHLEPVASRAEELERRQIELVLQLAAREEQLAEAERKARRAESGLGDVQKRSREAERELVQLRRQIEEAEESRRSGTDGTPPARFSLRKFTRKRVREQLRELEEKLLERDEELARLRAIIEQLSSGYASDVAASCISNIDMDGIGN